MNKIIVLLCTVAALCFASCSIHVSKEVYNNSAEYAAGKYLQAEEYFKGSKLYPKDRAKAYQLYKESAEMNYAPAMYKLAGFYNVGDIVEKAPQQYALWLTRAAQLGEDRAQNALGVCYETGNGISKDIAQARHWYEKAFEQGNTQALENLSFLCMSEKDTVGLKKYVPMGVEKGLSRCEFIMGMMYRDGVGVTTDSTKAEDLFTKAAEKGFAQAYSHLGVMQLDRDDYKSTMKSFMKALNLGDKHAYYNIGYLYEYGYGVEVDYAMASQYYQRALGYNNINKPHALFHLGRMLYEGREGLKKDGQKGLDYIKRAVQMGDFEATEYDNEMNSNKNN